MKTSLLIKADGTISPINPLSAKKGFTLTELYASLNCEMVEVVYPANAGNQGFANPILICDEEGLCARKNRNLIASILAGTDIVGDVIITESNNLH